MKLVREVSHRWQRHRILAELREGRVDRRELCDADFILVTASRFHGCLAPRPCPVCSSDQLREVYWIYGDKLGRRSGSARAPEEIMSIAAEPGVGEVSVHLVEVCSQCRWNHLLSTGVAAPTSGTLSPQG